MPVIETSSAIFIGPNHDVKYQVKDFLTTVKNKWSGKTEFQLVHALIFPKTFSLEEISLLNQELAAIYREVGFNVLGGDTSSGPELSVFISTIVS